MARPLGFRGTSWLAALGLTVALACKSSDAERAETRPDPPRPAGKEPASPPATVPEPDPDPAPAALRPDGTVYAETAQMGTRVSINIWLAAEHDVRRAQDAMEAAFVEIERLEDIMSEWRPQSELSRLGDRAKNGMDAPVAVSSELFEVLSRAQEVSRRTDGAFDVTFHGVGQLWSFVPGARPPTREAVARHLPLVDWSAVELHPKQSAVRLRRAGMKIGLGAIGKGYAVDRASSLLRKRGFDNHIVEAGGDTYVSGSKRGKAWMVGVQAPGRAGTVGILPSRDEAIVTSGDYQRYFEHEGEKYSHILDPRTGWPVARADAPRSVTVVAANATDADAYCTAVAVMGVEKGLAFVERSPDLEVIFIRQDDEIIVSSGLQGRYVPTPSAAPSPAAP